jgi:hypothetical protein
MEGIKRKTIQERGDPRIGRSWHYPEFRCGAAIQPLLKDRRTVCEQSGHSRP